MKKRIGLITASLVLTTASMQGAQSTPSSPGGVNDSSIQIVDGAAEGYKFVSVSLKDMTRIHCSSPITNVLYSKEKEIEIKTPNGDSYVKILPRKTTLEDGGEKFDYGTFPREAYIECGGQTFSIVMVPKDIPAQTIILKSQYNDLKKATEFERANTYEKTILELVKKGYLEEAPEGYDVKAVGEAIGSFKEIDMIHSKEYLGSRYIVDEFLIQAKKPIELSESMFVPYLKNPLAISIVKLMLNHKESTRMIVVRLNKTDGGR